MSVVSAPASIPVLEPGSRATVAVPVTTVWIAPDLPRPVDAAIVSNCPDAAAWLAALDEHPDHDETGSGRLGLHGRVETQLVLGEPVIVDETDPSGVWTRVTAPWQPSPKRAAGYPGWVPTAHLEAAATGSPDERSGPPASEDPASIDAEHPCLGLARQHLGLPYLWGGLTPHGLDCSGLVHHTWRRFGVIVPRDAHAQSAGGVAVPVDAVQPGDLYFFAHPGRTIHHVGIVVRPGRMVHASETGGILVEEDLGPDRLGTLVAAGRLPHP